MKKIWVAAFAAVLLSGCASSVLTVERPYTGAERFSTAQLEYDGSNVSVDDDNLSYTRERLQRELFGGDTPVFAEGEELTIKWRYVGFNEGSRGLRWLTGGIGGGGKVVLEVEFYNSNGDLLSTVRGEGQVGGGFAGGSNKSGIDKAVEEVAQYAAANLR